MQNERRSAWTMAAFALPCLPLAGLGLPLVVYLPAFYSTDLGLDLGLVGLAFGCVRIADIFFDPFIGGVMDRTRSRFGRFRPWFVLSVPILMTAAYMLFMAKPGVGPVYLWFWLVVVYAGVSISSLAQLAWGAVLSPDYDQRSRIYGWWQAGNVVGMILVLTLPAVLPLMGIKAHGAGVAAMGWFIILLTPLAVAYAVWRVPEPRIDLPPKHTGLKAYVDLVRRPSVQRILLADVLIGAGPAITGALFFFYFERVKGFDRAAASQLLLIYFLGGLAGAPLWAWLAMKLSKHRALALSGLVYAAMTLTVLILPPGNFAMAALLMFLIGVPYAAGAFLLRAMMADVGDEERLEGGVDRTGLLYALLSGTVKVGTAAAVIVTFPALKMFGFDPQATGVSEGLDGLRILFAAVPATLSVLASWVVLNFPLTPERHTEIRRRLAQRDLAEAGPEMGAEPRLSEEIHALTRPAE